MIIEQRSRDFSNNRRKLETMTGTGARDENLAVQRMIIEDEVFVGRVGVHANHRRFQVPVGLRQKAAQEVAQAKEFPWHQTTAGTPRGSKLFRPTPEY